MLKVVTITGLDRKTSFDRILKLSKRYPFLEVAVLVGSQTNGNCLSRFPSLLVVNHWREYARDNGIPTAVHLCGAYSKLVLQSIDTTSFGASFADVLRLCKGFGRVQVNLPSGYWNRPHSSVHNPWNNLQDFADWVTCNKVILQHREAWNTIPVRHLKVEYLFDRSGGRGVADFGSWLSVPDLSLYNPIPPGGRWWGYSGGLGPDNIHTAMEFVHRQVDQSRVWLDMESGVRTGGWLDLDKVEQVCSKVETLDTEHWIQTANEVNVAKRA